VLRQGKLRLTQDPERNSCRPSIDVLFESFAQELGADQALEFLREIDAINLRARQRVIDVVRADLSEDLTQYKIAVLGATFKPDSDDVRDSPALDIAAQLQAAGATVVVHDPKGIEPARKRFPNLDYAEKVVDCVKGADAVLHLTEWKEYRELDPLVIGQLVKSKLLIDGRNALDRDKWRAAGWRVHALGRSD
jgi:UDPglucose 6-dehydrogenase